MRKLTIFSLFSFFLHDKPSRYGVPYHHPSATEVRAVWLTTNYGLDWPRNRTSVEVQKRELREILDGLQELRFNTVFSGSCQGRGILPIPFRAYVGFNRNSRKGEPPFDPLRFAVEECHKRGWSCAWIVTYPLGNGAREEFGRAVDRPGRIPPSLSALIGSGFLIGTPVPMTTCLP